MIVTVTPIPQSPTFVRRHASGDNIELLAPVADLRSGRVIYAAEAVFTGEANRGKALRQLRASLVRGITASHEGTRRSGGRIPSVHEENCACHVRGRIGSQEHHRAHQLAEPGTSAPSVP
jgi:hypothetical protein